jgi:hypothetical protein
MLDTFLRIRHVQGFYTKLGKKIATKYSILFLEPSCFSKNILYKIELNKK